MSRHKNKKKNQKSQYSKLIQVKINQILNHKITK
jgi:hypothetical protein